MTTKPLAGTQKTNGHATRREYLAPPETPEEGAWRRHFVRAAREDARFDVAARFVRRDFIEVMRRLIPKDAKVLEVGAGRGDVAPARRHGPGRRAHRTVLSPTCRRRARPRDPLPGRHVRLPDQ